MTWIKSLILVACAFFPAALAADDSVTVAGDSVREQPRPVTSIYSLEIGGARNLSTYLSPLYYDGISFALSGTWTKRFNHWPDRCMMRFEASVDFDYTRNPARNAVMPATTARFGWGLSWRHTFARDWQVTVGPMLDIYGGALYSARNGNNPVSVLASAGIDAAASISWRGKFGRLPVEIADEVRIPTLSAFFCPAYGESYYEIYLGNHRDLALLGWWGNAFGIDNLISIKMNFGRTGMIVGYRFDLRRFDANSLNTQLLRNAFVIGVIPHGF